MKTHFINLFNYDKYANGLIFEAINAAGKPEKPVQLMAHLLAAQQVWFNRCAGLPPAEAKLWPALGETHRFADVINHNHQAWVNYLGQLAETDFENIISYKNTKGDSFANQLDDVIAHVINHGTHHRAQIGQLLKLSGVEKLPVTDYIFYVRETKV